jgi:hypothetical protein
MDFDKLVREWFYRLPKGYADAPYSQEELAVLDEVMTEAKLDKEKFTKPDQMRNEVDQLDQAFNDAKPINEEEQDIKSLTDKLIDVIKNSDLDANELNFFIKNIANRGLKGTLKDRLLDKGYDADAFKVGDAAVNYIIDKITDSEATEFLEYKPTSFEKTTKLGKTNNFPKLTGMSTKLFRTLFDIEPGQDAGGSSIGKGELFLALAFNDIDNRGGGGDLTFKGKNLEVKGTGGRLGQQGGRGSTADHVYFLEQLGEPFLQGVELQEFLDDPKNDNINYAIKDLHDRVKNTGGDVKKAITKINRVLDTLYFNKGLSKNYFGDSSDFKDLAQMKKNLLKLNAASYAVKTRIGYIIFINTSTGDYVLIEVDDLNDSIDAGAINTGKASAPTKNPTLGYKWNNPHPSLVIT